LATLIDSSVLIDAERGIFNLNAFLEERREEDFAISAITAAELLHGVIRAGAGRQRQRRAAFVEGMLSSYAIVPFDLVVARQHAQIWADLLRKGLMVGERDLMIAATALAYDFEVATRDSRSFPRISGLRIISV
jgi:tRNA(fMet)-specific endonuclease VapC